MIFKRENRVTQNMKDIGALLGTALFGNPLCLSENPDWEYIYKELKAQGLDAILGDVINHLPISKEEKKKWIIDVLNRIALNDKIISHEREMVEVFDQNNISFVILKGTAASIYYPQSIYRSRGDIDVLLIDSDFDKAFNLLENMGYAKIDELAYHITLNRNGVSIELHHSFCTGKTAQRRLLNEILMKSIDCCSRAMVDGYDIPMLPTIENGLSLLAHFKIHFEEHTTGIRQALDWMMYVNKYLNNKMWEEQFSLHIEELGLKEIALLLTRTCQLYLGLPEENITWCKDVDKKSCEKLMGILFFNGNFGQKRETYEAATIGMLTDKKGHFHIFKQAQTSGLILWEEVKKYPWLRPFAWIYAIIRWAKIFLSRCRVGYFNSKDYQIIKDIRHVMKKIK